MNKRNTKISLKNLEDTQWKNHQTEEYVLKRQKKGEK